MVKVVRGMALLGIGITALMAATFATRADNLPADGSSDGGPRLERGGQVVEVIDGGTLRINGERVRLAGIQAPAHAQQCAKDGRFEPCGEQATTALSKIVDLSVKPIECVPAENGVGSVCSTEGRDLAETLVSQGRVLADGSRYAAAEEQARKADLGLWGMAVVAPEAWRAGQRLPGETAARTRDLAQTPKPEPGE